MMVYLLRNADDRFGKLWIKIYDDELEEHGVINGALYTCVNVMCEVLVSNTCYTWPAGKADGYYSGAHI